MRKGPLSFLRYSFKAILPLLAFLHLSACTQTTTRAEVTQTDTATATPEATTTPSPTTSPTPTATPGSTTEYSITMGFYNICFYSSSSSLYCVGDDQQDSFGNGATTGSISTATSILTGTISSASYGGTLDDSCVHACAVKSGALYCWGNNTNGELGNGTSTGTVDTPTSVIGSGVSSVRTSYYGTCAIKTDGSLYCWGYNTNGQVGNGTTTSPVTSPYQVFASGVSKVSVGSFYGNHYCAIKTDGSLYCWGANSVGQVGNGATAASVSTPYQVAANGATEVEVGKNTTCAVVSGAAKCWGANDTGQVGISASASETTINTVIATGVTSLRSTGYGETYCALKTDGSVYCWGDNTYGQTGNGATGGTVLVPYAAIASGATAVVAGSYFFCALVDSGVKCWGRAPNHPTNGSSYNSATAVTGATTGVTSLAANEDYANGMTSACASVSGTVKCWGDGYGFGSGRISTATAITGHP